MTANRARPTSPPHSTRFPLAALLVLLALLLAGAPLRAQAPDEMPLWRGGAPGAIDTTVADRPSITPFLPPAGRATGAAVVVLPGGGYSHLATEKEGNAVARWLNDLGVAAFVVRYRLGPRYHQPAMLQDAQRAIRTVRARAAEWGVDPARIGVLGFSAGGHLASTTGTHFDAGTPSSADPVERAGSRPDFMLLVYPVITLADPYAHRGSRTSLLGEQPSPELVWRFSNETQVTRETPPTFLVATTDDRTVPVENTLMFYQALHAAGVPAEMHVFETGPHGFGLAPGNPYLAAWSGLAGAWMRKRGLLGR